MQAIESINKWLNGVVWGIPMMCLILGTGVYLCIRCGFPQFAHFGHIMKNTLGKAFEKSEAKEGSVSPFKAMCTALAASIGTGNIAGVSGAIAIGGPGAVFWMWVSALLGMCTKFAEVTLSIKFRQRNEKGDWVGGPMYYITKGLGPKWKWLAVLFAVFAVLASFGIGNMSQVNSITGSITDAINVFFSLSDQAIMVVRWILGISMALLIAMILIGGIKRIGSVTEKLVPLMSLLYILVCLVVLICHAQNIPGAFGKIFSAAFAPQAVMGAASGIALKQAIVWGLRRSAFSNEAGLGSAGIAHAAAETPSAVHQGLYGIFEVFMDTIVICSLTALTIICSGVKISFGVKPGSELIRAAFATVFGEQFSALFVAVALMLFAFSTVLGLSLIHI